MDNLIFFLTILAWPVAIVGTVLGLITLVAANTYEKSMTQLSDKLKNQKRTFYHWRFLIAALIAWAFIIAF